MSLFPGSENEIPTARIEIEWDTAPAAVNTPESLGHETDSFALNETFALNKTDTLALHETYTIALNEKETLAHSTEETASDRIF